MSNLAGGDSPHKKTQEHGKPSSFHIIVNARAHEVLGPKISYREVVNLAFPGDLGEILYSVHYVAPKQPDGTLAEGQSVEVENGMKFDVTPTNRS